MSAAPSPRLVSVIDRNGDVLYPQRAALQTISQRAALMEYAKNQRRALALMDAYDAAAAEDDAADLLAMSVIARAHPAGWMREELPARRNPAGPQASFVRVSQDDREKSVIAWGAVALLALLLVLVGTA